ALEFGDAETLGRIADDRSDSVGRARSATNPMAASRLHRRVAAAPAYQLKKPKKGRSSRPPVGNFSLYLRHELSVAVQWQGKVMIAGRRSKTVVFIAILALLTFGALATASAQPADIIAINKAFQDHYARGNYPAAQIEAQKLE